MNDLRAKIRSAKNIMKKSVFSVFNDVVKNQVGPRLRQDLTLATAAPCRTSSHFCALRLVLGCGADAAKGPGDDAARKYGSSDGNLCLNGLYVLKSPTVSC